MGRLPESPEKKRQMLIHLIQTTEQIITEDGFQAATIRAISSKADCNSASLYKYFQDLDELLLYACIKRLKNYLGSLASHEEFKKGDAQTDAEQVYLLTWQLFCEHSFESPECTYQLFFSKHSPDIEQIINSYFDLFPDELLSTPIRLLTMVKAADLRKRNWKVLYPLLEGKVNKAQMLLINDLTIAYFQMLLNEKRCNVKEIHSEVQTKRMLQTCKYLLSTAKQ